MTEAVEPKKLSAEERRADAKRIAEERRAQAKNRKRKCALCGTEENEKNPYVAHPDGIGPTCKEPMMCEHYRAIGKPIR